MKDAGCPAGTVLQPGQACAVQFYAKGSIVGTRAIDVAFDTSDGRYRVPVTFEVTDAPPPVASVVTVVEYFHAGFGHYFGTYLADEITKLDNGTFVGWARTGKSWKAWAQPGAGTAPVCRFFSEAFAPRRARISTPRSISNAPRSRRTGTGRSRARCSTCSCRRRRTARAPSGLAPVYRLYNERP